eukprot:364836-Chlamydomonas_euryale.AAC.15
MACQRRCGAEATRRGQQEGCALAMHRRHALLCIGVNREVAAHVLAMHCRHAPLHFSRATMRCTGVRQLYDSAHKHAVKSGRWSHCSVLPLACACGCTHLHDAVRRRHSEMRSAVKQFEQGAVLCLGNLGMKDLEFRNYKPTCVMRSGGTSPRGPRSRSSCRMDAVERRQRAAAGRPPAWWAAHTCVGAAGPGHMDCGGKAAGRLPAWLAAHSCVGASKKGLQQNKSGDVRLVGKRRAHVAGRT